MVNPLSSAPEPPVRRGGPVRSRRLGDILVARGVIDPPTLATALTLQGRARLRLGELIVAHGLAGRDDVLAALADQWSMGRVDVAAARPAPDLLDACDPVLCLKTLCLPWARFGDTTVIALAEPDQTREAVQACGTAGGRVAFALADAAAMQDRIADVFRDRLRDRALARSPVAQSCRAWAHRTRQAACLGVAAVLALGLVLGWAGLLAGLLALIVAANLCTTGLRAAALWFSLAERRAPLLPEGMPRLSRFRRLPVVSILVPLYREVTVLDPLLAALDRLDYPRELLDVLLVLEEDDTPMRNAVAARDLPAHVRPLAVPPDRLRTKPRAMNYALDFCRGEVVGIYDAEDRPDPGQIAAVVETFAESGPRVACVQARLGYYNATENWLARCFAIEYATWFHVLLPGVQRLGLPVPLGGTSVFFRRAALEAAGAWDAHNVTEDADLGMRLARCGWQTRVIGSLTLEEANCAAIPWVRQRSRWLKGYMATWISHARAPRALWRDLGPRGFFGLQVLLLGGATAYLALPFLWLGWAWQIVAGPPPWVAALPGGLMLVFTWSMILGQLLMVAVAARALAGTGQMRLLPWVLVLPLYWPLGALAAWKAVAELVAAPFYWDKTTHGVSVMAQDQGGSGRPSQTGGSAVSGKRQASGSRA